MKTTKTPLNVQCYERVVGYGSIRLERVVYRDGRRPDWRIAGFWNHAEHFALKKDAMWAFEILMEGHRKATSHYHRNKRKVQA